jgi:hypothetical protein
MTNAEFKRAFAIADQRDTTGQCMHDLSNEDISIFYGCGLRNFQPIVATVRQVASLIRWQALQLNGKWDAEALTEVRDALRRKATIVG